MTLARISPHSYPVDKLEFFNKGTCISHKTTAFKSSNVDTDRNSIAMGKNSKMAPGYKGYSKYQNRGHLSSVRRSRDGLYILDPSKSATF